MIFPFLAPSFFLWTNKHTIFGVPLATGSTRGGGDRKKKRKRKERELHGRTLVTSGITEVERPDGSTAHTRTDETSSAMRRGEPRVARAE